MLIYDVIGRNESAIQSLKSGFCVPDTGVRRRRRCAAREAGLNRLFSGAVVRVLTLSTG
jgi:hypothetical protein